MYNRTIYGVRVSRSVVEDIFKHFTKGRPNFDKWVQCCLQENAFVPISHRYPRIFISCPEATQMYLEIDPYSQDLYKSASTLEEAQWREFIEETGYKYRAPDLYVVHSRHLPPLRADDEVRSLWASIDQEYRSFLD